jgi:hypothetical protein
MQSPCQLWPLSFFKTLGVALENHDISVFFAIYWGKFGCQRALSVVR